MKFSIITVCYNAKENIGKTIESVLAQDYKDYEYIIVDGASTDGTVDIISECAASDSRVKYTSEKDNGLYDAMNKGASLASGDYIQFLNAGDILYGENTLSLVAKQIDSVDLRSSCAGMPDEKSSNVGTSNAESSNMCISNFDEGNVLRIFYGNIIYMNPDGSEDVRMYGASCGKAIYYATGDCVNHQACFASRKCFEGALRGFNADVYKICADRDWMMRVTKAGAKWIPMGITVVKYDLDEDSVSVKNKELMKQEERLSLKSNYPAMYPIYLIFDGCRNNKVLAKVLHSVYKLLYIRK